MGRKPTYNPEVHIPIAEMLSRQGIVYEKIAEVMCIDVSCLKRWRKKYPEFGTAIEENRGLHKTLSIARVENTYYKLGLGEVKSTKTSIKTDNSDLIKDERTGRMVPKQVKFVESSTLAPNASVLKDILRNRTDRWKDEPVDVVITTKVQDLTDEELEMELAKLSDKLNSVEEGSNLDLSEKTG